MSIPKSLKIFGLKFKVKVAPLSGILGLCDRLTSTIYIEANQSDTDKMQTLLHEVGHAVFGRVGLVQGISPELEEVIVENIATALVENFEIVAKIKTKDVKPDS